MHSIAYGIRIHPNINVIFIRCMNDYKSIRMSRDYCLTIENENQMQTIKNYCNFNYLKKGLILIYNIFTDILHLIACCYRS